MGVDGAGARVGVLVNPRRPVGGLVLAPGASAGSDQSALVAIDELLRTSRIAVRRIDFPYRLAGRRAPDRPTILMATIVDAADSFAKELGVPADEIALGGRSMGGRMCSMAVADGLRSAALVLVSYPLHPPGRPDRMRTEHFDRIDIPCLFVSGTRDSFGSPEELERATTLIKGPVTHRWIQQGDHGLARKDDEVARVVQAWITQL